MKMEEYMTKMKSIADNLQLAGNPLSFKDLFALLVNMEKATNNLLTSQAPKPLNLLN